MAVRLHFHFSLSCTGEGNSNPLQCSCLENLRAGGAWWAAVYGVAEGRTRLERLSSSSSSGFKQQKADAESYWTKIKVSAGLCEFLETVKRISLYCWALQAAHIPWLVANLHPPSQQRSEIFLLQLLDTFLLPPLLPLSRNRVIRFGPPR